MKHIKVGTRRILKIWRARRMAGGAGNLRHDPGIGIPGACRGWASGLSHGYGMLLWRGRLNDDRGHHAWRCGFDGDDGEGNKEAQPADNDLFRQHFPIGKFHKFTPGLITRINHIQV